MADVLKRNKNGCEITIRTENKKNWITATGKVTNGLKDAIEELNYSTYDPVWVMNQLTKTI